jgi:flagellar hook-associated protein 1 FlgK
MLFEGLSIANRGMAAAQLAINTTGQNITNATTEGYSRKRTEQAAAYKRNEAYGQVGYGVEVYSIQRVRDKFVDRLVNEENSRYGYYEELSTGYNQVQNIFNEPSGYALNSLLTKFWDSWSAVANAPTDAAARENLRSNTESLTAQFKYLADSLHSYRDSLTNQIEASATKINEITQSIYRCNQAIATIEGQAGTNQNANDTRDQRDRLLNELSQIINIEYVEDDTGSITVTCQGNMLVSAAAANEIVVRRDQELGADGYSYSRVELSLSSLGTVFRPSGGQLAALNDLRDVKSVEYEANLNSMAKGLVEGINAAHRNGYTLDGLTGVNFFDPEKLTAWTIDMSTAVKTTSNNIAAADGSYIEHIVDKTFSWMTGQQIDLTKIDPAGTPSSTQFYDIQADTFKLEIEEPNGSGNWNVIDSSKYSLNTETGMLTFIGVSYPNSTFRVSFDYQTTKFPGSGNSANATTIAAMRDKVMVEGSTVGSYYSSVLNRVGNEKNQAEAGLDTRIAARQALLSRQQEVSGVNLDEEAANLIQYQATYQACARYFTTINDMLDVLLNM